MRELLNLCEGVFSEYGFDASEDNEEFDPSGDFDALDDEDVAFDPIKSSNALLKSTIMSIDALAFTTKQDIIVMLLENCPEFEAAWMRHEGESSFDETYVSQVIFGYEIEYHPKQSSNDLNWFPVTVIQIDPNEIENAERSVSDNVVAKYAALKTAPPMILIKKTGKGWHIVEGGHRLAAAKMNGAKTISAVDVSVFFATDWDEFFEK